MTFTQRHVARDFSILAIVALSLAVIGYWHVSTPSKAEVVLEVQETLAKGQVFGVLVGEGVAAQAPVPGPPPAGAVEELRMAVEDSAVSPQSGTDGMALSLILYETRLHNQAISRIETSLATIAANVQNTSDWLIKVLLALISVLVGVEKLPAIVGHITGKERRRGV